MTTPEQLTIRQFLKDPVFRKYFAKQPKLRPMQKMPGLKPWRLYVQKTEDGPWQRGDLTTYKSAFEHARGLLSDGVYDIALTSKAVPYWPPLVKGEPWSDYPTSHDWCPYCRRPTVFWWFSKHHALRQYSHYDLGQDKRCMICGNRNGDRYIAKFQVRSYWT